MPIHTQYLYAHGELIVGSDVSSEGQQRIRDDEIVVIVKEDEHDAVGGETGRVYRVAWLRETPDDSKHPFVLSTLRLRVDTARQQQQLPAEWLDRHLLKETPPALAPASPSQLHVVVSTHSGLGQARAFYDAVLAPLLRQVFALQPAGNITPAADRQTQAQTYSLLVTSSPRSVHDLAHTIDVGTDTPAPTIVLLSGDGGVVDLLNGVASSTGATAGRLPTIALLPLGTGNALFHSLHRPHYTAIAAANSGPGPSPLILGLRTLLRGRPAPLPSFEATFAPGSHTVRYAEAISSSPVLQEHTEAVTRLRGAIVASYGFHAQLVWESDTPAYRRHGARRFGMAAEELLKTSHVYAADVKAGPAAAAAAAATARPKALGHRFSYVLVTLVSNLEKTFTISPASRPLDGQLRLVHFGGIGGKRTMEVMVAAYNNGSHVGMRWTDDGREEAVGYEPVDELEVTVHESDARWRKVCIDGTIVEVPQEGWMRVRKAAQPVLQVIVDT